MRTWNLPFVNNLDKFVLTVDCVEGEIKMGFDACDNVWDLFSWLMHSSRIVKENRSSLQTDALCCFHFIPIYTFCFEQVQLRDSSKHKMLMIDHTDSTPLVVTNSAIRRGGGGGVWR